MKLGKGVWDTVFNDCGVKWIMCFTHLQEIFLKLEDFDGFFKSLDFILVSFELFIPDAAIGQCCTCKTIKHYWIRKVMHSYYDYQPCEILKHDDQMKLVFGFWLLKLLSPPFPANVLKIFVSLQFLCMSG